MYPITSAGLAALRADAVQSVKIVCTPTMGKAFNITNENLIGECTADWVSVTGNKLEIGSACMSELSLTLENTDGAFDDVVFEGAQLYVTTSFPVSASSTATVPIGYYTVDSPPRKLRSIKITAYDRMAKFNRAYDSELSYPATLYQIVTDACSKCGVTSKLSSTVLNGTVSVPNRPESDNLTYRQVIMWAAQLMGVCLYIDYDGKLAGTWYATKSNHTKLIASDRFTSGNTDYGESDITFTGVRIVGNDENKTEYLSGTKDYAFNIEGNLLVQDGMDITTVATKLKNSRCSLTYRAMSCQTHSFPHLRPMDLITFESGSLSKQTALTNVKWTLNRNSMLESKGETATQAGYATSAPFTAQQTAVIEKVKAQQQASISDMEQATLALNETIANSMGLYVTRKADSNGAITTYYHDQPTLEGSSTIYCRNASGYAWTNSGWNSGSPAWQYGVSKDGDAVIRSIAANKISASYITTDILSSPTGKFSFNLDTGHISASDVDITGGDINLDGGTLTIVNNDGYKADLSGGVLELYQGAGTGSGTGYKYLYFASSLLYDTSTTGNRYASIALPTFTANKFTAKGLRIGTSGDNASAVLPVVKGLEYNWNTDFAIFEKEKTRVRKCVETNEAGFNVESGFIHHRSLGGKDISANMGVSDNTTAVFMLANNTDGTIPASIDLFASGSNGGAGASLQISGSQYTGRIFVDVSGIYAQFGNNTAVKLA